MSRFLDALQSGEVLLMDGAMGTELQRAGLSVGGCCEAWNLTAPERVRAVHDAYRAAGARVLVMNTFQSNPAALARHGLAAQVTEINTAALNIARTAAAGGFVLASVGPLEEQDQLDAVVRSLTGADGVLLETWSDPVALFTLRSVSEPLRELAGVPTLLSLTYLRRPDGQLATASGHPPEWFALQAAHYGVAALGVNCGRDIGMADVSEIIRRYRQATDLPLFARPNAGTPTRAGGQFIYPHTPETMAAGLPALLAAGAVMVGGCCGTTPAHIAAMRAELDAHRPRRNGVHPGQWRP